MKGGSMEIPKVITLNYLEDLDNGNIMINNHKSKFIKLTYDRMFKIFFSHNKKLLKRILINILHLNIDLDKCHLKFLDKELLPNNYNGKNSVLDFYIAINNNILLDLEINNEAFSTVKNRNELYKNKMIISDLSSGEKYIDFNQKKYIQLNLNTIENSKIGEDIIYLYSVVNKTIYIDNEIIYVRYLEYYYNLYYNVNIDKNESDYWLAFIASKSYVEMYNILKSFLKEKEVQDIIKDVIRISMNSLFTEEELKALDKQLEYDRKRYYQELKEQGISQGISQGIIQGSTNEKISIAKSMLKDNLSIELISKHTGLTQEEIEKLKEEL